MQVTINDVVFEAVGVSVTERVIVMTLDTNQTVEEVETIIGVEPVVEYEGSTYVGYKKLNYIQKLYAYAGYAKVLVVELQNVYNDAAALTEVFGEHVTYDQAVEMRADIEEMATNVPDEDADKYIWAFPMWSADEVAYAVGDRVQYSGLLYKCLTAHTSQASWAPDVAPSLWVRIDDPGEEWPEWRQPTGATDAYMTNDKVSHNAKHWISQVDNNTWEPGVYGWEEAE